MALPSLDDYFPDWKEREALAEEMVPIIGNLYRKNVVTYCFGRALYSESVTNIMKTHRYVRQIANNELSEFESYPIMKALSELDLGPCHIDVGKLALKYMEESAGNGTTRDGLRQTAVRRSDRPARSAARETAGRRAVRIRPHRPFARAAADRKDRRRPTTALARDRGTQGDEGRSGETREPVAARLGARFVQGHDPRRPRTTTASSRTATSFA